MDSIYQNNANRLYPDSQGTYRLKKTFFNVLAYVHENSWQGACHATTAIMFVLLREQSIAAVPCLGGVSKAPIVFDHSWIEVDSEVIDAAVVNTLVQVEDFPPVFLDSDLRTGEKTELLYGSKVGRGLDEQSKIVAQISIGQYMAGFPGHPEGLWGIAKQLAKQQGIKFSIPSAKRKWGDACWELRS